MHKLIIEPVYRAIVVTKVLMKSLKLSLVVKKTT